MHATKKAAEYALKQHWMLEVLRSLCKQPIITATPETLIINLIAGDSPRMQRRK